MLSDVFFIALSVAAGLAVSFQGATNQGLLKSIGIGPALIVNTVVVLIGTICLWLVTGAKTTFFPAGATWPFYLGGVYGFTVIAVIVLVFPRLGAAHAIALLICGQCLAAMIIDHYGLLGMDRSPATLPRILGIALVAGGAVVFRLAPSASAP